VQHTVATTQMRHTAVRHHPHTTCIPTHAGTRRATIGRRLVRWPSHGILLLLLWIVHYVLRLLSRARLVGVEMGTAIGIEGSWIPRAIAIRGCIHGL
jgi:hypothetical protein